MGLAGRNDRGHEEVQIDLQDVRHRPALGIQAVSLPAQGAGITRKSENFQSEDVFVVWIQVH